LFFWVVVEEFRRGEHPRRRDVFVVLSIDMGFEHRRLMWGECFLDSLFLPSQEIDAKFGSQLHNVPAGMPVTAYDAEAVVPEVFARYLW